MARTTDTTRKPIGRDGVWRSAPIPNHDRIPPRRATRDEDERFAARLTDGLAMILAAERS